MKIKPVLIFIMILVFFLPGCKDGISQSTETPGQVSNLAVEQTSTPTLTLIKTTGTSTLQPTTSTAIISRPEGYGWWNDVVFYELHVRSFNDSDGDGIGDFKGIIEKLDYLNDGDPLTTADLGVGAIWMMPIHPTTTTHGYDVIDYYDVNPQYGTMDDFQLLVDEAHTRGIRVIIDLVLNHSSSQNPGSFSRRIKARLTAIGTSGRIPTRGLKVNGVSRYGTPALPGTITPSFGRACPT